MPPLVLTDDEREELQRLTKRATVNRLLAFRARLLLACAEPLPNTAVAKRYRTTNATVGKWRHRFVRDRLAGLYDEPRVGAQPTPTSRPSSCTTPSSSPSTRSRRSKRSSGRSPSCRWIWANRNDGRTTPFATARSICPWLNLVERFFGLLTDRALRRGSHTSLPQLRAAIEAYVAAHTEEKRPFRWTKTADEILDKLRRFGLRTQQVHGK